MPGSLNDVLPDPISAANEEMITEIMKRKIRSGATLAVRLLHAAEKRFGPDARMLITDLIKEGYAGGLARAPQSRNSDPRKDLEELCAKLDKACVGTTRWERVINDPDRIGYHYTRCIFAEVLRELGEPDLGFVFCAGDEEMVKSWDPRLGLKRTQVIMLGDPVCDHTFYVENQPPKQGT